MHSHTQTHAHRFQRKIVQNKGSAYDLIKLSIARIILNFHACRMRHRATLKLLQNSINKIRSSPIDMNWANPYTFYRSVDILCCIACNALTWMVCDNNNNMSQFSVIQWEEKYEETWWALRYNLVLNRFVCDVTYTQRTMCVSYLFREQKKNRENKCFLMAAEMWTQFIFMDTMNAPRELSSWDINASTYTHTHT